MALARSEEYLGQIRSNRTDNAFLNKPETLFNIRVRPRSDSAVLLSAGERSATQIQVDIDNGLYGDVDIYIFLYEDVEIRFQQVAAILNVRPITKTAAFDNLVRTLIKQGLFNHYKSWMLIDDDLTWSEGSPDELIRYCRLHDLDIAHPSIDPKSSYNWYALTNSHYSSEPRRVTSVEIMCPYYSSKIVSRYWSLFRHFPSCWGIDILISNLAKTNLGIDSHVIDIFQVTHQYAPNTEGGSFYNMLKKHNISPENDLNKARGLLSLEAGSLFEEV
jgi:hypothetical protein